MNILAHLPGTPPSLVFSRGDSPLTTPSLHPGLVSYPAHTAPTDKHGLPGQGEARSQCGGSLAGLCFAGEASVGPRSTGLVASLTLGTGTQSHHCHIFCVTFHHNQAATMSSGCLTLHCSVGSKHGHGRLEPST